MSFRNFILAALAGAFMVAGSQIAKAGAMNVYGNGQMVPYATFTTGGPTTAVGLLVKNAGTIYWAFYDGNGNRRHNGNFSILADRLHPFIWSSEATGAATDLSGTVGYLVFALDTNGDAQITGGDAATLSSNAFYVDLASTDVAYVPTLFLDDGFFSDPSPANWTNNPVTEDEGSTFVLELPRRTSISLNIYDMAGDLVRTLIPERTMDAGTYGDFMWRGDNVSGNFAGAGLYIYVLKHGNTIIRKPISLYNRQVSFANIFNVFQATILFYLHLSGPEQVRHSGEYPGSGTGLPERQ